MWNSTIKTKGYRRRKKKKKCEEDLGARSQITAWKHQKYYGLPWKTWEFTRQIPAGVPDQSGCGGKEDLWAVTLNLLTGQSSKSATWSQTKLWR